MLEGFMDKFFAEETWLIIGESLLQVLLIFVLSRIVIKVGKGIISKFFLIRANSPIRVSERRDATLLRLLKNILTYTVNFITIIMILEAVNIEVKALLAGAGIIGLAVGFGAQSLVKDVIMGFFIIFEDQFSVGDQIKIKDYEGEVMEIGLRTTKIKSSIGQLFVIPNGSILEVTNFSILNSVAVVDLTLPYDGDIERAEKTISHMLESLPTKYEDIVKMPQVLGIQSLSPNDVVLRITAETAPMRHYFIGRVLRKEIKNCIDENHLKATVQEES
ncbi:mechanosensitive ion channel protein MscS [Peribacillus loiseleuriae]|uniref:Mechanosensitive ion channel protein MscS n=2 Tax=Peribacillus loiseleuriae TaxID=1679170 RepID=A0A0K9H0T6_9BACI|nr:mechanosensitive ion channel protein MscS [Peribacillus loiseleuriae]